MNSSPGSSPSRITYFLTYFSKRNRIERENDKFWKVMSKRVSGCDLAYLLIYRVPPTPVKQRSHSGLITCFYRANIYHFKNAIALIAADTDGAEIEATLKILSVDEFNKTLGVCDLSTPRRRFIFHGAVMSELWPRKDLAEEEQR